MSPKITDPFSSLEAQLLSLNEFFDSVVNMIPSHLYVSSSAGGEEDNYIAGATKYHKGMHKESKEAKRTRQKAAKVAKYENPETTVEIKSRIRRRQEEELQRSRDDDGNSDNGKEEEQEDQQKDEKRDQQKEDDEMQVDGSASRIEHLRAKLRAKIAEKQRHHNRSADGEGDAAGAISKRAARRAEKLKRMEAAKAKKNAGSGGKSTVVQNSKKAKVVTVGADARAGVSTNTNPSATKADDLAGIDFGVIAGLKTNTPNYINNKSLANIGKTKSLDRLLQEVETKRKRLKELKEGDEAKKDKATRIEWGDTMKEASGERVRDDPAMIKKAMKRKAKQKDKSAKAWEARNTQVEESGMERQKIRAHNLEKRKVGGAIGANLSKKRIVSRNDPVEEDGEGGKNAKRRRMGPHSGQNREGFEGKKREYINGDSSNKKKEGGNKVRGTTQ